MSNVSLQNAGLQDIKGSSVVEGLADIQGRSSRHCDVEYGTRRDDGRLTFHFFPPGYAADNSKNWEDWTAFRDRLEAAVLAFFPASSVDGGWVEELKSFYIITDRPVAFDLATFLSKFFEKLEA
jgi:hypothetical protein